MSSGKRNSCASSSCESWTKLPHASSVSRRSRDERTRFLGALRPPFARRSLHYDAMPDSTSGQAPRRPARVGGDRGTQRAPVPRLADAHHVAARAPRGPLDPHRGRRQPNRRQLCAGDDSRAHPRSLDRGRLGQPLEWEDYDLLQQGCSRGQDGHGRLARCGLVELRGESSRSQGAIDHTDSAMSFAHLRQGDFLPGASWYEETDRSVTRDAGETLARVCSRDEGARPLLDEKGPVSRAFLFVGGA